MSFTIPFSLKNIPLNQNIFTFLVKKYMVTISDIYIQKGDI